jgi:endonuclease/exonuclease/phosphatase family metal-dependent hydrolase
MHALGYRSSSRLRTPAAGAMALALLWGLLAPTASAGAAAPDGCGPVLARPADDTVLRVMSFNVRFAARREGHQEDWAVRRPAFQRVLDCNDVDLLGTQELVAERDGYTQQADILAMLPGFAYIGRSRSANPNDEQMGVYYRTSRLEALAEGHVWLSPTPAQPGSYGYGNRGNARMVTWARFRDRRTGAELMFLNTHFDHASEDARYRAADQIAGSVEGDPAYAGEGIVVDPSLPVVVTGDFNFPRHTDAWYPADLGQPTVDPIKPLRPAAGAPGLAQLSASSPTIPPVVGNRSSYRRLVTDGPFADTWDVAERTGEAVTGTFNGFGDLRPGWIDWILVRGDVRVLQSHVDTYRPDGVWPSDHVPVVADLVVAGA